MVIEIKNEGEEAGPDVGPEVGDQGTEDAPKGKTAPEGCDGSTKGTRPLPSNQQEGASHQGLRLQQEYPPGCPIGWGLRSALGKSIL
jgi:hypothetical protein